MAVDCRRAGGETTISKMTKNCEELVDRRTVFLREESGFLEDYSVDLLDLQPVLFLSAKRYWKAK